MWWHDGVLHIPPVEVETKHQSFPCSLPSAPPAPSSGKLIHHSMANNAPVSFNPKKWMTGIHGTVNKYLVRRHLAVFVGRWSNCLEMSSYFFFQKHSIIRSCHMMSPCPSRPLAAKKLVPIWSHFPCPLLQSVVKFFRIPTKFTLNQQIHRAGVMSSMFQDKLLTDWWGPLGWQFWWGPFAFTNGLKRQYTWLLRRPGLSSTNLFLGLHGQAAFDLCPLNQWWEKKH